MRMARLLSIGLVVLITVPVLALVAHAHPRANGILDSSSSKGNTNKGTAPTTLRLVTDWLQHHSRAMNFIVNMLFVRKGDDWEWDSGEETMSITITGGSEAAVQRHLIARRLRAQLTGGHQTQSQQGITQARHSAQYTDFSTRMERLNRREKELQTFLAAYDFDISLTDEEIRTLAIERETSADYLDSTDSTLSRVVQAADPTFCSPGLYLKYPRTKYICNGAEVTQLQYVILSQNVTNNCSIQNSIEHSCLCQEDRKGDRCQNFRSIECSAPLLFPVKECLLPANSHDNLRLDGDFSCLRFTSQDVLDFSFNLTCNFTEPLQNNEQNLDPAINYTVIGMEGDNFTLAQLKDMLFYYAKSDHFKISTQIWWSPFQLKFFDLNTLSNNQHVWDVYPTPEQWVSTSPIEISGISLGTITQNRGFVTGGRLYAEAGWRHTWAYIGFLTMRTERLFIDLTDEEIPRRTIDNVLKTALYISVPTLIAIAVGLLGSAYLLFKLYKRHERVKEDLVASLTSQPEQSWYGHDKNNRVDPDDDENDAK